MPNEQRHAESASGVTRRGLDPYVVERAFTQEPARAHAVETDAPGDGELPHARLSLHVAATAKHDLVRERLDRRREIHFALCEGGFWITRRATEEVVKLLGGHGEPLAIIEVAHVHAERAVVAKIEQVLENELQKSRLTVGSE